MSYVVVDVEADGPIPNKYSMVCFGAVVIDPSLSKTFLRSILCIGHNLNQQIRNISQQLILQI